MNFTFVISYEIMRIHDILALYYDLLHHISRQIGVIYALDMGHGNIVGNSLMCGII